MTTKKDLSNGMKFLCFILPFVGFIIWMNNRKTNTLRANEARDYCLFGFFITIIVNFLIF